MLALIPLITFIVLAIAEKKLPVVTTPEPTSQWDHLLNGIGLFMQGCVIPVLSFWISQIYLAKLWPHAQGIWPLGWWSSFCLNFIFVDFVYYWQHRAFHHYRLFWKLHKCHHAAAQVDIWTTSRNSLLVNFLFVYCLLNPILGFLCATPAGFYAGAMLTASLDIFRHSCLDLNKILPATVLKAAALLFVLPKEHHLHHSRDNSHVNFGANFILWDKLFNTAHIDPLYPRVYGLKNAPHPLKQLLYPLIKD